MLDNKQAKRLKYLAKESPTWAELVKEASRFPNFYGFPNKGTIKDWKEFHATLKETSQEDNKNPV